MRQIAGVVAVVFLVAGCAALNQAREDYARGKETPLAPNEIAPEEAAHKIVDPVAPFIPEPFRNPVAAGALSLLTIVGTWQRGRRERKGQPVSVNPITGPWGNSLGLEFILQNVINVVRGASEVGAEGSGARRAWKVGLSLVGGATVASLGIPAVKEFITQNPQAFLEFGAIVAALAGVEKELSKVLPVAGKPS